MPIDLKHARILISNDDGVEAQGLALLERIARTLSDDVWVVAPLHEQSGAGHSLSLHKPLRIRQHAERRFSVDGTPTDAVLLGVMEVMKDKRPDLMLSGINRGSNLAEDVTYSGTVSAAMEATLLEIPSIAFSNQISSPIRGEAGRGALSATPLQVSPPPNLPPNGGGTFIDWRVPEAYTAQIIARLAQTIPSPLRGEVDPQERVGVQSATLSPPPGLPPQGGGMNWHDRLMNVNFPGVALAHVKGIKMCPQGRRKLDDNLDRRVDPQGRPYVWIGGQRTVPFNDHPESDINNIREGYITITPLSLDMTDYALLEKMREGMA